MTTTPTHIERELTLSILKGGFAAGTMLPTIRELARTYSVSPATMQRAISRLKARGLVTARQGSGLLVNDSTQSGDLSLLPLWLEISAKEPKRAAAIVADFLEIRRLLTVRMLVRHKRTMLKQAPQLIASAAKLMAVPEHDVNAMRDADLSFARVFCLGTGNLVALGVLNTMGQVLHAHPLLTQAMYAEPKNNLAAIPLVLSALTSTDGSAGPLIEAAISKTDEAIVRRYQRLLEQQLLKEESC